jgi:hypothetical protein
METDLHTFLGNHVDHLEVGSPNLVPGFRNVRLVCNHLGKEVVGEKKHAK